MAYFSSLPKSQLRELSRAAGISNRSPALHNAWADQTKLQFRYANGEPVKKLAREYKVTERSMYRIVRGR